MPRFLFIFGGKMDIQYTETRNGLLHAYIAVTQSKARNLWETPAGHYVREAEREGASQCDVIMGLTQLIRDVALSDMSGRPAKYKL